MQQALLRALRRALVRARNPKPAWMTQITSVAPRLVLVLSNQIVRSSTIVYNLYLNWLLYSSETLKAIYTTRFG